MLIQAGIPFDVVGKLDYFEFLDWIQAKKAFDINRRIAFRNDVFLSSSGSKKTSESYSKRTEKLENEFSSLMYEKPAGVSMAR